MVGPDAAVDMMPLLVEEEGVSQQEVTNGAEGEVTTKEDEVVGNSTDDTGGTEVVTGGTPPFSGVGPEKPSVRSVTPDTEVIAPPATLTTGYEAVRRVSLTLWTGSEGSDTITLRVSTCLAGSDRSKSGEGTISWRMSGHSPVKTRLEASVDLVESPR